MCFILLYLLQVPEEVTPYVTKAWAQMITKFKSFGNIKQTLANFYKNNGSPPLLVKVRRGHT